MKKVFFAVAIIAISVSACKSNTTSTTEENKNGVTLQNADSVASGVNNLNANDNGPIHQMVTQYLKIKNALVNDNGNDAANAGTAFVKAMNKLDKNSLSAENKKTWDNIADDAKEMAKHISENANKIEHQREHFEMLSMDMFDLVKSFGAGQPLYLDFCPMANNKKGATWLSETKEISNPYLGKKMPACGEIKEEINL